MINPKQLAQKIILTFFLFSVFFVVSGFQPQTPPVYAASCTTTDSITAGQTFNVGGLGFDVTAGFHQVSIIGVFPTPENTFNNRGLMSYDPATSVWSATIIMPATAPGGEYVVRVGSTECLPHLAVTAAEGGSAECDNFGDCTTIPGIPTPPGYTADNFITKLVGDILPIAIGIGGFLSVIIVIISGLQFITSNGNPEGAAAARGRLIFALVGFVLLILAFAITKVIDSVFLLSGTV